MHTLIYHISETCNKLFHPAGKVSFDLHFFFFPLQLKTLLLLLGREFKFQPGWERLSISISNSIYLVNKRTAVNIHFFRDTGTWLGCSLQVWSLSGSVHRSSSTADISPTQSSPRVVPGGSRAVLCLSWSKVSLPRRGSRCFLAIPMLSSHFLERRLGVIQSNGAFRS